MDWRVYICPPTLISVACGLRPAGEFTLQRRELERAEPYYRRLCRGLGIRYEVVPLSSFSWVRWFLRSCFRILPLALLRYPLG